MPKTKVQPTCGQCGAVLLPGVQHRCPVLLQGVQNGNGKNPNWLAWIAFGLQFLVLFGTIMWKASSLQRTVEDLQKDEDATKADTNKRLENIERYFRTPLPGGDR